MSIDNYYLGFRKNRDKRITEVNVPTSLDVEIEDLYDWICVHVGFDEEKKEIHEAIKKFGELRYTQGKEKK